MSVQPPVKLFFSYSHQDEDLRKALGRHLIQLERQKIIEIWHDRKIDAGDDWQAAIAKNLDDAEIIILLISVHFLASDYCYESEFKRAMQRHTDKKAVVVPISLRPCHHANAEFMKCQGLPKDFKPVTTWLVAIQ